MKSRHQCLIYAGSPSLQIPALATTLQQKLNEGYRCMYLNSPAMVAGLRSHLASMGIDVMSEVATTHMILSSESVVLEDGNFDIDSMLLKLESALDQALKDGYKGLWATGDMTWEFGSEKNLSKLLEYEYRLEKLFRKREGLCGICQYHQDTLPDVISGQALQVHQTIFVNETTTQVNPAYITLNDQELDQMITHCQKQNEKT